jgi:hypothetical protein
MIHFTANGNLKRRRKGVDGEVPCSMITKIAYTLTIVRLNDGVMLIYYE